MRLHFVVSGILLTLHFIDFALAAPVPAQEIPHTGDDVMDIPKDATTMLGKRDSKFNDLLFVLFGDRYVNPEELPAAIRLAPADGWTDATQPLASIPEEPEPVSSPDHGSPSPR
jgi:hypothetical protein